MRTIPPDVYDAHPHNYDSPVTRGPALVVVNAVLLSLATVAYTLRIYTRKAIQSRLRWDDVTVSVAFVLTVGLAATVMLANVSFYWNRHVWDVPQYPFALARRFLEGAGWTAADLDSAREDADGGHGALRRSNHHHTHYAATLLLPPGPRHGHVSIQSLYNSGYRF